MTIAFLDAYRTRFPVLAMCAVLEFSERTYYASRSRPPSAREGTDAVHKVTILAEWIGNYSCYGCCRTSRVRMVASCRVRMVCGGFGQSAVISVMAARAEDSSTMFFLVA